MMAQDWGEIAAAIRAMSIPELSAFQSSYGITIVSQDTKKMKRYDKMTAEEKEAFLVLHGIDPDDVGLKRRRGRSV